MLQGMKRPQATQPAQPDPDQLLAVPDVARLLGVTEHTIRSWSSRGDPRLPTALRVGKNFVRWRRRDVLERIEAMATGGLVPA